MTEAPPRELEAGRVGANDKPYQHFAVRCRPGFTELELVALISSLSILGWQVYATGNLLSAYRDFDGEELRNQYTTPHLTNFIALLEQILKVLTPAADFTIQEFPNPPFKVKQMDISDRGPWFHILPITITDGQLLVATLDGFCVPREPAKLETTLSEALPELAGDGPKVRVTKKFIMITGDFGPGVLRHFAWVVADELYASSGDPSRVPVPLITFA